MAKQKEEAHKRGSPGALFIPGGLLLGLGLGFVFSQIVGGLFIGLGVGFLLFAVYEIMLRRR